jgi:hypothetical protein
MPSSCSYTWPDTLDTLIRQEAQAAGVPLDLAYAIIAVESGFDPDAHVDNALEDSVGLLQLNRRGGQGAGFSVATLSDPLTNLRLGLPHIAAAFAAVWTPTIDPYEYIYQVATRSGHPGPVPRDDPRIRRLAEVWSCFYPAAGNLYMGSLSPESAQPGPAQSLVALPLAVVLVPLVTLFSLVLAIPVLAEEVLAATTLARRLSPRQAAKVIGRHGLVNHIFDRLQPDATLPLRLPYAGGEHSRIHDRESSTLHPRPRP